MYGTTHIAMPGAVGAGVLSGTLEGGAAPTSGVLPNTGAPTTTLLALLAAVTLITVGVTLMRRKHEPRHRRRRPVGALVLAGATLAVMGLLVTSAVVDGRTGSGWGATGLAVALFTIGYLGLAVRNLLPAGVAPRS
ncbi:MULTISPECIES: LPXTG cell wall anchor domain-containing protein [unclassified Nocardioides]|uniref:LPXTG cell wall anchor domain-containing protein n=1 Tax=unclassified Nocardioides TaxID=2615069 RepID=UPI0006F45552|nr:MULTISPECIES: LPXTG cell wall anchor domain-containing protein [unclassified Nocardioides]KQY61781.1 hypothetical protein ASD30_25355 [Nocardioides sp. Root140]KQZ70769.1 hypothetical protein ASD66_14460 [Nocardioides sp. Root151]KRF10884.1 hypothetical protein ASH02_18745 [Nocardioides sp. Soil796]